MQKQSAVWEGSDGVGAGRDGLDKWRGSWRGKSDVRATKAAIPDHWASIERRRKRTTGRKDNDKDKGRSSKRARRAIEARVADLDVGARVDAREQPDYHLRGRDDDDAYYGKHEYDTIWGDTVVASRREPCPSPPPLRKLDFEAVAQCLSPALPESPRPELSTPVPASVLETSETPEPPPIVRQRAFIEHASLSVQKLDLEAIELEAPVANPPAVRREASSCDSASELLKTLTVHEEWDAVGEQIYKELHAVSKGAADTSFYYSPAMGWMLEDMCVDIAVYRRAAAATRIQACWRGMVARDDYQDMKARKEKWEKRAVAKSEAKAMQLSYSERLKAAAPRDQSAGLLVVNKIILGHSIANDEPLYGGKCFCVGMCTGVVQACLLGSVTVVHDAPDAFYDAAWDFFERHPDKACDVRHIDLTGREVLYNDISSLRELLSFGPPYKLDGNLDLHAFLAKRREPLGYTKTGRRLVHSQDLIFAVVAAVFTQSDVVLLDAATAMPLHAIVRCQRHTSRRLRSTHAHLR
ncbi:MAG: hypothetical protein CBC48_22080 [bacterium TMED88]|nr:MAG: hypothetical protein CBC48_22080 [bacterium TMED88]